MGCSAEAESVILCQIDIVLLFVKSYEYSFVEFYGKGKKGDKMGKVYCFEFLYLFCNFFFINATFRDYLFCKSVIVLSIIKTEFCVKL